MLGCQIEPSVINQLKRDIYQHFSYQYFFKYLIELGTLHKLLKTKIIFLSLPTEKSEILYFNHGEGDLGLSRRLFLARNTQHSTSCLLYTCCICC